MNRRTFMKFLLGTVASIAVNPIDALSRPAQPMPIPRQPVPEPVPVDPIIEISNYGQSIKITETFNDDFLEFIDPFPSTWFSDSSIAKTRAEAIQKTRFMQYVRERK